MKYKHHNPTSGVITIYDSKGQPETMLPGQTVEIDRIVEQNGIVCLNKDVQAEDVPIDEDKPKKRGKSL
jgi:hypothetical protein